MKPETYLNKTRRIATWDHDKETPRTVRQDHEPYQGIFPHTDGVFSTNGIVVHIFKGDYTSELTDKPGFDLDKVDLGTVRSRIACTKEHLKRAIKASRAFKPRMLNISVNSRMDVSAQSKYGNSAASLVNGDTWIIKPKRNQTVLYRHLGQEWSFHIDPKYIWDAISACGDILIIEFLDRGLKIYSDDVEIWIMYMTSPESKPVIIRDWIAPEIDSWKGTVKYKGAITETRWSRKQAAWLVDGNWRTDCIEQ